MSYWGDFVAYGKHSKKKKKTKPAVSMMTSRILSICKNQEIICVEVHGQAPQKFQKDLKCAGKEGQ